MPPGSALPGHLEAQNVGKVFQTDTTSINHLPEDR